MNPKSHVLATDKTNPDVGWALPTFIALDDFNVFFSTCIQSPAFLAPYEV
jgi:hypothetical protein